jgi:hypothetical protein
MKKLILLTAIAFFISGTAFAQDDATDHREDFHFGVKIGTNYSNVYDSEGEDFEADSKFGWAMGAFLTLPIGKYFGIQPEVLYSQKGFKGSGTLLGSSYSFTRTTTHIDVPLFLAIKPIENLTLLIGPQYSYLSKQKDEFTNALVTTAQEKEFENDDIRKNMLCFGIGVDLNIKNVVLGARSNWDVQKNNGDGTSTTPRYKNVWYQFTFGYRFTNKQ